MSIIKRNHTFSVLDDFFNRELLNWGNNNFSASNTTIPSVNIKESAESFDVEVAAPGMDKKDFNITLDGNTLTISSQKQQEQEQEKKEENYTRREFSYQSFRRSFELPKDVVDADKINAKYENGVLYLTIPKREEAKKQGPRMIEIG
jgi:HSP20 family protein